MKQIYPEVTIGQVLKEFWKSISKYKISLALDIVGISIPSIIGVIVPLYYRQFFNALNVANLADKSAAQGQLVHIILMILALNGVMWVGWRLNTFSNNYFQSSVMASLRQRAFDYLIEHSYSFFTNNFTGSLTQRVNRFARAFERLSDRVIFNLVPLSISIIGITISVWFVKPIISIILFAWLTIFLIVNYFFSKTHLKYDIERAETDSEATAVLSDVITNHNVVQLFTGFNVEIQRFEDVTNRQAAITKKTWNAGSLVEAVQAVFTIGMEFFLFYFAIRFWIAGSISLGVFVMLQAYLIGLGGQLWNFSRVVRDFYEGFADAKEMVEIMRLPHQVVDIPNASELSIKKNDAADIDANSNASETGEITFKKVTFNFNQTRTVLDSINLTVKPGQKIALVGPSGAGKSTLVRLLLRLYDVQSGEILVDGQNIAKVTQKSLHENISFVPQDPVLFHRSLMENIRYGRKDATDDEVIKAAELAHCDEFINDLPLKYETFVGERGIKLSGGERQRVAIARAILKNAPILILDEATSSLDSHSEALIQDALEKLIEGKTTLVIAHRLSTIRKMDRIIVLDHGKIIQDGTHQTLSETPGMYQKLWDLQAGGFLREEKED